MASPPLPEVFRFRRFTALLRPGSIPAAGGRFNGGGALATEEKAPQVGRLRRDVSIWGSFMWGYADVGADIFTALGLVAFAAQGGTPVAFLAAGLVYVLVGLCYTELASTYPAAGGGQYFTLRGLGDAWGFIAGAALMLDYTIDIALFAVSAAGYLNYFLGPDTAAFVARLGPFYVNYLWLMESILLILSLVFFNYLGIRVSSRINEYLGVLAIAGQAVVVVVGFALAWRYGLFHQQLATQFPSPGKFMYGSSLAIISFVGLESISQVAQETRRPSTVIPRSAVALVLNVLLFALAFSVLGNGLVPWQALGGHQGDPVAFLARHIPLIGAAAGPAIALLAASIVYISANSGVMSVSRLSYSMSRQQLLPRSLSRLHPRFATPYRTILLFSGLATVMTMAAFLSPSPHAATSSGAMDILANMYAFGASLGYLLVFIALMVLRFRDPAAPRPFRMPWNIPVPFRGRRIPFPVLGVLGFLGVGMILFEVILTHAIGRVAGPAWILLLLVFYLYYRRSRKLPLWGSAPRDWVASQRQLLEDSEEYELLEEYEEALQVEGGADHGHSG